MIYSSCGFIAFGAITVLIGVSWLRNGGPGGAIGTLPVFIGGATFALLGVVLNYLLRIGGVARLHVDQTGLHFTRADGSTKDLLWTDPRFQADVYDVSAMPGNNSFVRDDPIWRYGLILRAPFLTQCRFPREMYDALLAGARTNGLSIEPSSSSNFDSGEVALRLRRAD
jgi:hypothetical protein